MKTVHISRRDVLRAGGLASAWAALTSCSPAGTLVRQVLEASQSGVPDQPTARPAATEIAQPPPLSGDALLLHTLRRMSFGATEAMLDRARTMGLEAYVEEQLDPEALDDSQVEEQVQNLDALNLPLEEMVAEENRGRVVGEFLLATLLRQTQSPRQFYEMMVDFWTNHFNIYLGKNLVMRGLKLFDDRDVIRPQALASFRELLRASAHSPAMLVYLDQAQSGKDAPNENYARELLELHTLGVDGGYSQQDVYETARTLTGWSVVGPRRRSRVRGEPGTFVFRPFQHDDGEKQVLDLTIPAGSGQAGGELLLETLAEHPSTARFVSHKLAVRFVADDPPASIVDRLADTFEDTGGDVKEMLRTLIFSPEFAASAGQKVKRPLEFLVSLVRVTDLQIVGNPRPLAQTLRQLGQIPYGWPTPDGYPDHAGWWLTTSGLLNRWNLAMQVASGGFRGVRIPYRRILADAESAEDVVDLLSLKFLGEPLPGEAREGSAESPRSVLVAYASEGELRENVPAVAGLILGSPQFQVR